MASVHCTCSKRNGNTTGNWITSRAQWGIVELGPKKKYRPLTWRVHVEISRPYMPDHVIVTYRKKHVSINTGVKCDCSQEEQRTEAVNLFINLAKKERKGKPTISLWIFLWQNKAFSCLSKLYDFKHIYYRNLALTEFGSKLKQKN